MTKKKPTGALFAVAEQWLLNNPGEDNPYLGAFRDSECAANTSCQECDKCAQIGRGVIYETFKHAVAGEHLEAMTDYAPATAFDSALDLQFPVGMIGVSYLDGSNPLTCEDRRRMAVIKGLEVSLMFYLNK